MPSSDARFGAASRLRRPSVGASARAPAMLVSRPLNARARRCSLPSGPRSLRPIAPDGERFEGGMTGEQRIEAAAVLGALVDGERVEFREGREVDPATPGPAEGQAAQVRQLVDGFHVPRVAADHKELELRHVAQERQIPLERDQRPDTAPHDLGDQLAWVRVPEGDPATTRLDLAAVRSRERVQLAALDQQAHPSLEAVAERPRTTSPSGSAVGRVKAERLEEGSLAGNDVRRSSVRAQSRSLPLWSHKKALCPRGDHPGGTHLAGTTPVVGQWRRRRPTQTSSTRSARSSRRCVRALPTPSGRARAATRPCRGVAGDDRSAENDRTAEKRVGLGKSRGGAEPLEDRPCLM